ncbi:hypothetical protein MYX78_10805, partial [Acidobacteria bacterium AH-259-G07]|nr:hypothetical protein [Acidobacteria bacterium AH-259-G07]
MVKRMISGKTGTLQIWIENALMEKKRLKEKIQPPNKIAVEVSGAGHAQKLEKTFCRAGSQPGLFMNSLLQRRHHPPCQCCAPSASSTYQGRAGGSPLPGR